MRRLTFTAILVILAAACAGDGSTELGHFGVGDTLLEQHVSVPAATGGPEAGTVETVAFTLEQASAALILVNHGAVSELRRAPNGTALLTSATTDRVIAARPVRSIVQLAAISGVGPVSLRRLRAAAPTWPGLAGKTPPEPTPGEVSVHLTASTSFLAKLTQSGTELAAELAIAVGGDVRTSPRAVSPELHVDVTGSVDALVTVRNYGRAILEGTLSVTADEPEPAVPSFDVLFTDPLCHETGQGVRDGARCNGTEKAASMEHAGIHARLLETIRSATTYKQAHPEAPVKLYMTYLSWYHDGGLKAAVLDAIHAGVEFQGYFDPGYGVEIPAELEAMNDPHVRIGWLGGHTDNEGVWRLMHIKLTMVDYGSDDEPMRIVFSSANLSPSGLSLHFENFVFARVLRSSNFAQRHLCAMQGLEADKYPSRNQTDSFANVFEQVYDDCVAQIATPPDPALNVFFTPDEGKTALGFLKARMREASGSIDMAIEHYSEWSLAGTQTWLAESIPSRLVLDDQTLYMDGESSEGDNGMWRGILQGSSIDQRFVRTNADIHQLQHNKYVVIDGEAVFCGAGNFTGAAFRKNYENFYYLAVPSLAARFQTHFDHLFDDLGSRLDEIPPPLTQAPGGGGGDGDDN